MSQTLEANLLPVPGAIIFPLTRISLTLNDKKYAEMIRHSVKNEELIIVSWTKNQKDLKGNDIKGNLIPHAIGVLALPAIIHETDTEMTISLVGIAIVKILRITETSGPFIKCMIDTLDEDAKLRSGVLDWEFEEIKKKTIQSFEKYGLENIDAFDDHEVLINQSIMSLIKSDNIKQMMLEELSLDYRLYMLKTLCQKGLADRDWDKIEADKLKRFFDNSSMGMRVH